MNADERGVRLTDAEWAEFQAIPDQGYSHRDWLDKRFAAKYAALPPTAPDWERVRDAVYDLVLPEVNGGRDSDERIAELVANAVADAGYRVAPAPTDAREALARVEGPIDSAKRLTARIMGQGQGKDDCTPDQLIARGIWHAIHYVERGLTGWGEPQTRSAWDHTTDMFVSMAEERRTAEARP